MTAVASCNDRAYRRPAPSDGEHAVAPVPDRGIYDVKNTLPVNVNGVLVRTLKVGPYRVVAQAEGYVQQRSVSITLEGSREYVVDVTLEPDASPLVGPPDD